MRALWAAGIVAAALLAGCLGEEETNTTVVPPLPPAAQFLRTWTVVDPNGGQGEPSLGVTPEGVLWTNGRAQGGSLPVSIANRVGSAYRSDDNGTTWQLVETPVRTPDLDPDLAVDRDGTVWFDTLYIACVAVAVSDDDGASWFYNPAVCPTAVGDRQYLIPTSGGEAYLYFHQLPTFHQTAVKTTDGGMTWLPTGPVEAPDHSLLVSEGSGWGGGGFWNPSRESVWFTFSWFGDGIAGSGAQMRPAYSVTRDGGVTWEVGFATPGDTGQALGLGLVVGAADDLGNVYIAWGGIDGDDVAIYVAGSQDDGVSWTDPMRIDDGEGSKVYPAIAAGAPGHVAVAFYEADKDGYPNDLDAATWNVTLAWSQDFFGNRTFQNRTWSPEPVREGAICPDGSGCGSDREFLDYFALERLPDGRVAAIVNSSLAVGGDTVNVYADTNEPLLGAWPA